MSAPHPLDAPWSIVRRNRAWTTTFALGASACVAALIGQATFLRWNESRPGTVLEDPVLALFEPVDLSSATFTIVYAGLALGLFLLARRPRRLSIALWAYGLTASARILLMWFVPLDPPPKIIPLVDPLVSAAADGVLTRDLFFSGHTATLCLLALAVPKGRLRPWFWAGMVAVAACTVLQHTHYVVDVLVAPLVATACFRLAQRIAPRHP